LPIAEKAHAAGDNRHSDAGRRQWRGSAESDVRTKRCHSELRKVTVKQFVGFFLLVADNGTKRLAEIGMSRCLGEVSFDFSSRVNFVFLDSRKVAEMLLLDFHSRLGSHEPLRHLVQVHSSRRPFLPFSRASAQEGITKCKRLGERNFKFLSTVSAKNDKSAHLTLSDAIIPINHDLLALCGSPSSSENESLPSLASTSRAFFSPPMRSDSCQFASTPVIG
jgi:hypothetical protein